MDHMRASGFAGAIALVLMGTGLLANRRWAPHALPHGEPVVPASVEPRLTDREPIQPPVESNREPGEGVIREIPLDTLSDVAVATYSDEDGSAIYYNPRTLEQLGPFVSAFIMAHERGHIHFKHTRSNALLAGRSALDSVLQGRELAADCFAAEQMGRDNRAAVVEAVRFFGRLGSVRFDAAHPSGSQRAATILSCLPVDSTTVSDTTDLEG